MTTILANRENSCPLRHVTNYMGTLRKVKGVHPLMDKGFGLLWYICMGEVQVLGKSRRSQTTSRRSLTVAPGSLRLKVIRPLVKIKNCPLTAPQWLF
ncbi:hypothetical protein, partial [Microcystis sp. M179S2]|uniref:hypothetical protein n=1 Tax=Microcystis sp. M179S2 TaxID=2771160 RepID=UPI00258F1C74